jgi:short-subunit dehydrogenase
MAKRGAGGQIVNVASAAAFHPSKDLTAYHAAKAGVLMLSECMRAELIAHGIGVTAVCPGIVATNITHAARFAARGPEEEERLRAFSTRAFALRNFPPERVAAKIVGAIGDDTPVAVVTPEAKLLRLISRVSPGMMRRLARVDMFPF